MSRLPRRKAHWFKEQVPSETLVKSITVFVAPDISAAYHQGYNDGSRRCWETDKEVSELAKESYGNNSQHLWTHYLKGFGNGYNRQGRSVVYGTQTREHLG